MVMIKRLTNAFLVLIFSIPAALQGMEAIEKSPVIEKPNQPIEAEHIVPVRDPEEFFKNNLTIDIWRKILANLDMYDSGWRFVHRYVPLSPDEALAIAQDIDTSFSLIANRLPEWLKYMEEFLKNGYWSARYAEKRYAVPSLAEDYKRRKEYMKREYSSSPYRPQSFFVDPTLPIEAVTSEAVSKTYSAGDVTDKHMPLQRLKPLFIPLKRVANKNDSYKQIRACLEEKVQQAKTIIDEYKK